MRLYATAILISLGFVPAIAQNKQEGQQPILLQRGNPSEFPVFSSNGLDLLTAKNISVIPTDIPTQFNEGALTAEEQFHDKEIADLAQRLSSVEESTDFARGAIWAIGIVFAALVALLGAFWKGIARVVVAEACPRILNP
ncbi:MAG TPA: hypothetical protein VHZ09_03680 [Acidobacteriaceae bacterium]|jgi:hypothetical protein|nr:hypothetical protein [Acidobacteriaceae bacterium]